MTLDLYSLLEEVRQQMDTETQQAAKEYEEFQVETGGQDVIAAWFPSLDVPRGNVTDLQVSA